MALVMFFVFVTQKLQVNSDLVHSSCKRPANDDACPIAVVKSFELSAALLPLRTNLANSNLVTDNLDRLCALGESPIN